MKVILSRKGFDSSYGKMPSPILPDGTLLSLPIPIDNENNRYVDLHWHDNSYYDIIKSLKPNTDIIQSSTCHLDPDLREGIAVRTMPWYPLFGQCSQAQSHLAQNNIGEGDLFLFWGWFRESELHDGKLRFVPKAPNLHVIWGYMKIAQIKTGIEMPPQYAYHPHGRLSLESNAIYEGDPAQTGVFMFHPKLVLTKAGMSRSKWEVPDFFRRVSISYHSPESFRNGYFQSAMRGQEFVFGESSEVEEWAKELIGLSKSE